MEKQKIGFAFAFPAEFNILRLNDRTSWKRAIFGQPAGWFHVWMSERG